MIKLYCPPPTPSAALHPLFMFAFAPDEMRSNIFNEEPSPNFFQRDAQLIEHPEGAQAIVLPNNFKNASSEAQAYITHWADIGERLSIPVYLFSFADLNDTERFDVRVTVFRLSAYRKTTSLQDVVVPTTANDMGSDIALRDKTEVPRVSFCGQGGYNSTRQWVGFWIKNLLWDLTWQPERKQGVYWRRRMMRACSNSELVSTNFIVRRSFSGALRTIELPPAQARKEFYDSIRDADFVLAPKGDGNYSNRFLEALSLGRIPVVVDTGIVLPLEDIIDYSKIMVRVPMADVAQTPNYIRAFYDALSEAEWHACQRTAREVFETYLRQDQFFRYYFNNIAH